MNSHRRSPSRRRPWVRTGDLGSLDADGLSDATDRSKRNCDHLAGPISIHGRWRRPSGPISGSVCPARNGGRGLSVAFVVAKGDGARRHRNSMLGKSPQRSKAKNTNFVQESNPRTATERCANVLRRAGGRSIRRKPDAEQRVSASDAQMRDMKNARLYKTETQERPHREGDIRHRLAATVASLAATSLKFDSYVSNRRPVVVDRVSGAELENRTEGEVTSSRLLVPVAEQGGGHLGAVRDGTSERR